MLVRPIAGYLAAASNALLWRRHLTQVTGNPTIWTVEKNGSTSEPRGGKVNHSNPGPKYVTEVQNVREVTLIGSADLAYWQEHLAKERLFPYIVDRQAELIINAVELKWMGIDFKELIISLPVCESRDGDAMDGYYLVQAFNSSRLLALSEKLFFQNPYAHGTLEVNAQVPAFLSVAAGQSRSFLAEMSETNTSSSPGEEDLEGRIFVPNNKVSFAKLSGAFESYPFLHGQDTLEIETEASSRAFRWLVESNLTGKEWRIRRNGTHARSRTYKRPQAFRGNR
jgi:hypothetical protein